MNQLNRSFQREQVFEYQPQILKSLLALGNEAARSLDAGLVHLIKLRVSQINGCGFCMHMHAGEARQDGESQDRLDVLPAWREVPAFSEPERAALAWAEALTQLPGGAPQATLLMALEEHFSAQQIVDLSALITTINGWNRIAVGFAFTPGFGQG